MKQVTVKLDMRVKLRWVCAHKRCYKHGINTTISTCEN